MRKYRGILFQKASAKLMQMETSTHNYNHTPKHLYQKKDPA